MAEKDPRAANVRSSSLRWGAAGQWCQHDCYTRKLKTHDGLLSRPWRSLSELARLRTSNRHTGYRAPVSECATGIKTCIHVPYMWLYTLRVARILQC